ncbi:MAG TPA: c-type cytochrome [Burkholderiaceae bacterium]|nr:c-type cytochrome [Burkholderiaceae bacterium]
MNMPGDRLGAMGWLVAGLVAIAAFGIGFIWLPSLQASTQGGLWDAICRAAGIYPPWGSAPKATLPAQVPTTVAWDVPTLRIAASGDAQRGSALAAGCAACHGAKGISPADAFPNLAGLPAEVMYKQLDDYRTGKRQNPIMQGMVAALSDQQIADLAAHFAPLPAGRTGVGGVEPPLVRVGSPLRSIAPCAACHGPQGRKEGAPPLHGQKRAYLQAQLDAFATGVRHNDINQQMREVARALSAAERDALADWYGEKPHGN